MNNFFLKLAAMNYQKALIFGVIAAALYYFFMFNDGSSFETSLLNINQQVATEEKKQRDSEKALKEVDQIRAQVAALGDQYKLISAQIPTDSQMADFLKLIDSMASTSGVNIRGKEPKKPERRDRILEELPIRVVAEGSYAELTLFLYNLMSAERVSRILSFSINLPMDRDKKKALVMDAILANYRFLGEEPVDPKAGKALKNQTGSHK